MTPSKRPDELSLRYQEACAQDSRRPSERVRAAVHAHAAMVIGAKQTDLSRATIQKPTAANQTHWRLSLLASIALLGLTGLLVLQFDRGTPEEQDLVLGRPGTNTEPTPTATAPQPQSPAAKPAADADSESAREVTRVPRAVPAPKARPTRPEMPATAPARSDPALAVRREAIPPSSSSLPSPATEPVPVAETLSAQLADAAAAGPANIGAMAKGGVGATSEKSTLRAAKGIPEPVAIVAPQQRLDKGEQPLPAPRMESPGVMDLTRALHASARAGEVAQIERLLKQGALINAPDAAGRTPLMIATRNGHAALVARLLALGANPALTDQDGLTALQHARQLGQQQIAGLLDGL